MANSKDRSSVGFLILGILFPIVGLILYLVWKNEYPNRAKSFGKGAIIGGIVCGIIAFIFILALVISIVSGLTLPSFAVSLLF